MTNGPFNVLATFHVDTGHFSDRLLPGITFAKTAYEAAFEADVLVVITEWHEFRGLDPRRIKQVMRQPRIVDLRNIFNPEEMRGLGFTYEGIGRPQPRN